MANIIADVTDAHIKSAIAISDTTRELDIGSTALQRWKNVANMSGSVDAINNIEGALKKASDMVVKWHAHIPPSKEAIQALKVLGVDLMSIKEGHSDDIIDQLRANVRSGNVHYAQKKLTQPEIQKWLDVLAPEFGSISQMFFKMGDKEYQDAKKNAHIQTPKDINQSLELDKSLKRIHEHVVEIGNIISRWTSPVLESVLEKFEALLRKDDRSRGSWWDETKREGGDDLGYFFKGAAGMMPDRADTVWGAVGPLAAPRASDYSYMRNRSDEAVKQIESIVKILVKPHTESWVELHRGTAHEVFQTQEKKHARADYVRRDGADD